ncbi:MAG: hypothetical protein AAF499_06695 [Pseudomonadota bacterium]
MTPNQRNELKLITLGAGSRLLAVAFVIALLWAGFFWATSAPGGL